MKFRWNQWNIEHISEHGVLPGEAEAIVVTASRPYPLWQAEDKWLVWGPGAGGRLLQVVYVLDEDDQVYVIHARPLTDKEKQRHRRRTNP